MFCNHCGAALHKPFTFCSACGKPAAAGPAAKVVIIIATRPRRPQASPDLAW